MQKKSVLIFGSNEYAREIYNNVNKRYVDVQMYALQDTTDEYGSKMFDLSDEWSELSDNYDMKNVTIFCVLQDEAKNIFLTLSLHTAFTDATIIALAKNKEDMNKLKMAGATKVIPIVETTALIIAEMIKKPVMSEVLHDILYEDSALKLVEVTVHNAEHFHGEYPADINWSRDHGVLVVSIFNNEKKHEFIYSSKTKHQRIQNGDVFTIIGYEADIEEFKRFIGEEDG